MDNYESHLSKYSSRRFICMPDLPPYMYAKNYGIVSTLLFVPFESVL